MVDTDVLLVEGDNRPGSLARSAHRLAEAGVNIEYLYCSTGTGVKKGLLVLRVSETKKALKVRNT